MTNLKIVAISDTHNRHKKIVIPPCDILIHAGDWTSFGYKHEVEELAKWFNKLLADGTVKEIVAIPGNHEKLFEKELPASRAWVTDKCPGIHILIDEAVVIDGVKIYGSPITPWFYDWAWNRQRGQDIQKHWDLIPADTNILVTHGPPYGILDTTTYADGSPRPGNLGCYQLAEKIKEIKPDLHIFGHIHSPGGQQKHIEGTSYYNAAICDETYAPTNPITVIDYIKE